MFAGIKNKIFKKYLFVWLYQVFVVAREIFVVAHGILSCVMSTLSCSVWDLVSDQELNPGPMHWEYRVLATDHKRSPQNKIFEHVF